MAAIVWRGPYSSVHRLSRVPARGDVSTTELLAKPDSSSLPASLWMARSGEGEGNKGCRPADVQFVFFRSSSALGFFFSIGIEYRQVESRVVYIPCSTVVCLSAVGYGAGTLLLDSYPQGLISSVQPYAAMFSAYHLPCIDHTLVRCRYLIPKS